MFDLYRVLLALVVVLGTATGVPSQKLSTEWVRDLRARAIGPATMSGRIAAIASEATNPDVLYVGGASSGLWRTRNAGLTWEPLFEEQPTQSIGAIAVHPRARGTIWVGTGEANPRNSAAVGRGLFKSDDGGASWKHVGLAESERISRILLDPSDAKVAWVAVLGKAWGDSEERGVYHTADGGETWTRQLHVDARTGCADLVQDPVNPRKLFAAMWSFRRRPWTFESGGSGSGLHVSRDGGATWRRLSSAEGLPEGELGRIGLAIAPSDPERVYAIVEAEKNVFLRSNDGGLSFVVQNDEHGMSGRPFYYSDLRVDPKDADRVYRLESLVHVSDDAGKSWRQLVGWKVHPDHHALWIHPQNPRHLVGGNDGGLAISRDHGEHWRFVPNLPFAQLYHVDVDDELPYRIYFGLQDNGSWRGPSEVWENGGIRNHHWQELLFGDGFRTLPVRGDERYVYAMWQQGNLRRVDSRTGRARDIKPVHPEGTELRFAWNAALALDPHDRDGLWFGSQFLHYSPDRGETWELRSPDLTTDRPEWQRQEQSGGLTPDVTGAENFTTLLTIAPSTLAPGLVWVGTDDGRLHVTRDGGSSWDSCEERIGVAPAHTWIPHVEASTHEPGRAYVVFDDHRRSNTSPLAARTEDFGKTWTALGTDGLDGYLHTLLEDPVEERLLFAGGEFGLFVSLDRGATWTRMRGGLPMGVPVRSLALQTREHDLIVGTHGRGVFVYDDIRVLRRLARAEGAPAAPVAAEAASLDLWDVAPVHACNLRQTGSSRFPGDGEFRGPNPSYGARFDLWLRDSGLAPKPDPADPKASKKKTTKKDTPKGGKKDEDAPKKLHLRVFAGERILHHSEHDAHAGFVRLHWDLRVRGDFGPGRKKRARGPRVRPGEYEVRLGYGELEARRSFRVLPDPRAEDQQAGSSELTLAHARCVEKLDELGAWVRAIDERKAQIAELRRRTRPDPLEEERRELAGRSKSKPPEWRSKLKKFEGALKELDREIWRRPNSGKGIQRNKTLSSAWHRLEGSLSGHEGAPARGHALRVRELEERHAALRKRWIELLGPRLAELRAELPEDLRALLPARD